ncbi:MAG: hypothetical protein MR372_02785 [Lachnospiraceae bacterium]|nr:hypothetical protein [Lachnospiraceae bacterium]
MFLAIAFVRLLRELAEHGFVLHVVPVDQIIIPVRRAFPVYEGNAAAGIGAVKGTVEIVFRPVRGIHHGIVYIRSLDGEPAEKVSVPFIEMTWR